MVIVALLVATVDQTKSYKVATLNVRVAEKLSSALPKGTTGSAPNPHHLTVNYILRAPA